MQEGDRGTGNESSSNYAISNKGLSRVRTSPVFFKRHRCVTTSSLNAQYFARGGLRMHAGPVRDRQATQTNSLQLLYRVRHETVAMKLTIVLIYTNDV
jgi:hypothetical protein